MRVRGWQRGEASTGRAVAGRRRRPSSDPIPDPPPTRPLSAGDVNRLIAELVDLYDNEILSEAEYRAKREAVIARE
jgi:hypothetical protein